MAFPRIARPYRTLIDEPAPFSCRDETQFVDSRDMPCKWTDQFDADHHSDVYRDEALDQFWQNIAPLSILVNVPFCRHYCQTCVNNKIMAWDRSAIRKYLDYLSKEIRMQAKLVNKHRTVLKLQLDRGAAAFLKGAELTELMHNLACHYKLTDSERREYSVELDFRTVALDNLALLKGLGFNQLSVGIQGFDDHMKIENKLHKRFNIIKTWMTAARVYGFKSISYDLVFGHPSQTLMSLGTTLDKMIELSPDRMYLFHYSQSLEEPEKKVEIGQKKLPVAEKKVMMVALISDKLTKAGYLHLGMDCFVKPADALMQAQKDGLLQSNFQGYSTCLTPDLIGLGLSSTSSLQGAYFQNECKLEDYYLRLCKDNLPIANTIKLNDDNRVRQAVITQIVCDLVLDTEVIAEEFNINFAGYFCAELLALKVMERSGLLLWDGTKIMIRDKGRLMLKQICMPFE